MADAIRIGDPVIEVRLRRNARACRMVLRAGSAHHGPTLTLPPGVPIAQAASFLSVHEGWLRRHLEGGAQRLRVGEGSVLPFGDETLTVRRHSCRSTTRIGNTLVVGGRADGIGVRVAVWLREQARAACIAHVERHASALALRPGRMSLRDPSSRWGSCTSTGDLMFSWRLVMAPASVLDYVVAHEVAHLAELNHSPRFWAVVRHLCPGMEKEREWLRRHGAGLHRHDFGAAAA